MLGLGLAALTGCTARTVATPPPGAAPASLQLLGTATLPYRMAFQGTTVGGLSGIDYDPASGLYALISDDRSALQPARIYTARIALDAQGLGTPELASVITLQRANGQPWPSSRTALHGDEIPDPEAVRWRHHGGQTTLLWTTEGDLAHGFGPRMRETRLDGSLARTFVPPAMFAPSTDEHSGPRDNKGFEGLALTPDGSMAWLAMEGALVQDGPLPTATAPGGPCRLTCIDLAGSGRAVRQIAYIPDALPHAPLLPGGMADNGISEILMLGRYQMLVLERSYVLGHGVSLRLYRIDTRRASNTLNLPTLTADNHQPAAKTLLADFATLGLPLLDNTEGMTWGPVLPDGRATLVVVSDDNFNPLQTTQFAAFAFAT